MSRRQNLSPSPSPGGRGARGWQARRDTAKVPPFSPGRGEGGEVALAVMEYR